MASIPGICFLVIPAKAGTHNFKQNKSLGPRGVSPAAHPRESASLSDPAGPVPAAN
jgi:hypothetical protein